MNNARRRTIAIYGVALVLPLLLFVALQAAFSMQTLRSQIEADALERARAVNAAVDAELRAELSALEVLSTSELIVSRDWPRARARVADVQRARPAWRDVTLTDVAARREIWATTSASDSGSIRPWVAAYLGDGAATARFGGVVRAGDGCPCVTVHVPMIEAGAPRHLLSLRLAPAAFQDILLSHAPAGSTSALVDRDGIFIGRTLDYHEKLGTPATRYVRDAIARGDRGLYEGVTYEGLRNYTAFETSRLTGWSTHVAVKADLLSGPRLGSILLTGLAGLTALLMAFVIAAYAYRQSRLRRDEEARIAQSEKLAALGRLAAGVAHDFNNLLMVIDSNLRKIATRSDDPALRRPIDNALLASERGALLIRELMTFTRSQPLDLAPVDLAVLVGTLDGMLRQSVGEAVNVTIDIAPDARWVTSNGSQMEMALLNLAVNAKDAMPDGGRLTIRSRRSREARAFIDLEVTDTGEGMPREVLDRAMEPFFTTKPPGKGTGLGLAQVFGTVSQSGGSVEIRSTPGAGTTILLRLQATAPETAPAGEVDAPTLPAA
ncbi:MAG: ATP-binding protein [Caulobacter sp.]|nr:ATP-binding protein [Caulobacter sp.]